MRRSVERYASALGLWVASGDHAAHALFLTFAVLRMTLAVAAGRFRHLLPAARQPLVLGHLPSAQVVTTFGSNASGTVSRKP